MEADIDEIMEYPVDATEVGETKRCLSEGNYRSYRALGERHLLFEGRRGKQWINVLRGRCRNLDRGDFYIMEPSSGRQLCSSDQFEVADRLTSTSFGDLGVGIKCSLGEFKPVTRAQVEEIEKLDREIAALGRVIRHPGAAGSIVSGFVRLGERGSIPAKIGILE